MSAPSLSVRQAMSFAWKGTRSNFWRLVLIVAIGAVFYGVLALIVFALELLPVDAADASTTLDPTTLLEDPAEFLLDPDAYRTNPVAYLTPRNGVNLVVTALQVLVALYLALGLSRIALSVTTGKAVKVTELFTTRGYGRYVGGTAVHAILLVVGIGVPVGIGVAISALTDQELWTTIGRIIGSVIAFVVTLGFIFYGYVIIDRDSRVVAGIRDSHDLVRPHMLRLFGLCGLMAIVIVVPLTAAWVLGTWTDMIGFLVALPLVAALVLGMGMLATGSAYRQLSGQATV